MTNKEIRVEFKYKSANRMDYCGCLTEEAIERIQTATRADQDAISRKAERERILKKIFKELSNKIKIIDSYPYLDYLDLQLIIGGYLTPCRYRTGQNVVTNHDAFSDVHYNKYGAENIGKETFKITKILYHQHGWIVYGISDKKQEEVWHHENDVKLISLKQ